MKERNPSGFNSWKKINDGLTNRQRYYKNHRNLERKRAKDSYHWHNSEEDRARRRKKGKDWYRKNPKRALEHNRAYRKKHPKRNRRDHLLQKYGLSIPDFESMVKHQGNKCAICHLKFVKNGHEPSVDHNHKTGNVRGLLCMCCNLMLGSSKDNPDTLRAGASYLEKEMKQYEKN